MLALPSEGLENSVAESLWLMIWGASPRSRAVQHLLSGPRLPFTAAYFGSIAFTLYFSLGVSARIFLIPSVASRTRTLSGGSNIWRAHPLDSLSLPQRSRDCVLSGSPVQGGTRDTVAPSSHPCQAPVLPFKRSVDAESRFPSWSRPHHRFVPASALFFCPLLCRPRPPQDTAYTFYTSTLPPTPPTHDRIG